MLAPFVSSRLVSSHLVLRRFFSLLLASLLLGPLVFSVLLLSSSVLFASLHIFYIIFSTPYYRFLSVLMIKTFPHPPSSNISNRLATAASNVSKTSP